MYSKKKMHDACGLTSTVTDSRSDVSYANIPVSITERVSLRGAQSDKPDLEGL